MEKIKVAQSVKIRRLNYEITDHDTNIKKRVGVGGCIAVKITESNKAKLPKDAVIVNFDGKEVPREFTGAFAVGSNAAQYYIIPSASDLEIAKLWYDGKLPRIYIEVNPTLIPKTFDEYKELYLTNVSNLEQSNKKQKLDKTIE